MGFWHDEDDEVMWGFWLTMEFLPFLVAGSFRGKLIRSKLLSKWVWIISDKVEMVR